MAKKKKTDGQEPQALPSALPAFDRAAIGELRPVPAPEALVERLVEHGLPEEFAQKAALVSLAFFNEQQSAAQIYEGPTRTVAGAPFAEFKAYADQHQWKTRRDRGYAWGADVFQYIQDVYGCWIDRGKTAKQTLVQADIGLVDARLWSRLQQEISKRGKPETLMLPAVKEAALEHLGETEIKALLAAREASRKPARQAATARRRALENYRRS